MLFRRAIVAAIMTLSLAAPALADVQLGVDVGWSNRFRGGRWTPLYITLSNPQPRQVTLEVYSPTDRRYAMRTLQSVAIGPAPVTVAIYTPMSYRVDEASVIVRDGDSNKRLADYILADTPSFPGQNFRGTPEMVQDATLFAGVSGNPVGVRAAEGQLDHIGIKPGMVEQARLPATPVGYEALDLLVLNQPELASGRISADQQRAIADWVRAGGKLLIWPGAEPMPAEGPLAEILPASVGPSRLYAADPTAVANAGLPGRFAKLNGRALTNPAGDAKPIHLLGATEPFGYRRWVGFGQVVMLGFDPTQFMFNNVDEQRQFWRGLLAGVLEIADPDPNQQNNYWESQSRRMVPLQKTMNWLGNVPGAGSFGFGYVAATLLALMFVVGPVDWFVLKWTGRQPWTWVTISGWIALVTLGAIYVGHVFKSGELHFRTASLIDEAGGVRVASVDLIGIYSPRTQDYTLAADPYGWWRPGGDGQFYGGGGLELEIPAHQDYRGNTPYPMSIGVWNLRFLENQQFGPSSPPIVDARLKADAKHVAGKVVNRGTVALSELTIRTHNGVARVHESIAPGASLTVDAPLNSRDNLATMPVVEQRRRFQRFDPDDEGPATRPSQALLAGIGDTRADQIDRMLRERSDVACLYANYDAGSSERAKLNDADEAKQAHIGMVRALVPLE